MTKKTEFTPVNLQKGSMISNNHFHKQ